MAKAPEKKIEVILCQAEGGFQVQVRLPGTGLDILRNWIGLPPTKMLKEALEQQESLHVILKQVLKSTARLAAPSSCAKCKSENVWHKSLDGNWSRICADCDHTQNLNAKE